MNIARNVLDTFQTTNWEFLYYPINPRWATGKWFPIVSSLLLPYEGLLNTLLQWAQYYKYWKSVLWSESGWEFW